ncbi:MAG: regulatory iron-sulfur-containing complex subunit RicT, partial [Saprospiraceae bacterium]
RQESARIGGLGSCGRELCCSTWLSDFKSVSTTAARYQNLAINQTKLSGQCGRLKCCLNYELDTYMDALQHFPKGADKLHTEAGVASLIKTDVFKGLMYYIYNTKEGRGKFYPLKIEKVKEIQALNKEGKRPQELMSYADLIVDDGLNQEEKDAESYSGGDLTGVIELPPEKRRRKKRKNKNRNNRNNNSNQKGGGNKRGPQSKSNKPGEKKNQPNKPGNKPANKSGNAPKKNNNPNAPKQEGNNKPKKGGNNNNRNKNRKPRPPRGNKPNNKGGNNNGGDKGGNKGGDKKKD